jgi:hypothetical protein
MHATHSWLFKKRSSLLWQAKGRVNVIGAIVGTFFLILSIFKCYVNSDVFYAWLTQDLLPKVPKDAIIVIENASFHNA